MRHVIGFFVDMNLLAIGQLRTEFPLNRIFRIVQQPGAELAVFRRS